MTYLSRHLISIDDMTEPALRATVARGVDLSQRAEPTALAGAVVGIYFKKTSTRTRTAFTTAALRLGADVIAYGPQDLQLNTGETLRDTGRVLGRMLDALVVRTAGPTAELRELADERLAFVNAMSEEEHPTQALADLTAMQRRLGRVDGLRVLYVGEGNNSATALALALSRFKDVHLEIRTPQGYGVPAGVLERTRGYGVNTGFSVNEAHDLENLPRDFDVIYTTRWQTTGTTKADPRWREQFAPFQVQQELWARSPGAVFMHDLPAHRGDEVTGEVLDGPASIAFDQAEMKMYSAMAVLCWALKA
ncbi:ornithine carbamoyltransferase [Actinoplanes sp. HUAS TT8]|uniref:ornithine carbamoyltransferase n=1 Tax=Actinoplanes sp. HUAS TT8 TaxID=3447453 RepID=UPI003F52803F